MKSLSFAKRYSIYYKLTLQTNTFKLKHVFGHIGLTLQPNCRNLAHFGVTFHAIVLQAYAIEEGLCMSIQIKVQIPWVQTTSQVQPSLVFS